LASIGQRAAQFPLPYGPGDEARNGGGPDPREALGLNCEIYIPDLYLDAIKVKTRNFR